MAFLDETGLAELWSLIQEEDADVTAAMTAFANTKAQVAYGSYSGTGTYGSGNPSVMTFNFEPKLVVICSTGYKAHAGSTDGAFSDKFVVFVKGGSYLSVYASPSGTCYFTMDGNTFSRYSTSNAQIQCNGNQAKYNYVAIG